MLVLLPRGPSTPSPAIGGGLMWAECESQWPKANSPTLPVARCHRQGPFLYCSASPPPPQVESAAPDQLRRRWLASAAAGTRRWVAGRGTSTPPPSSSSRPRPLRTSLLPRCVSHLLPAAPPPHPAIRRVFFLNRKGRFCSRRGTWTSSRHSPPSSRPTPSAPRRRSSHSPQPGR
jgi:hypothetical protein